jgi:hypothetical protein
MVDVAILFLTSPYLAVHTIVDVSQNLQLLRFDAARLGRPLKKVRFAARDRQ